jgi:hypothetical protein
MNQDSPSITDLLATVEALLNAMASDLDGEARYQAQVGAYLLAICGRELRFGTQAAAEQRRALNAFLGVDGALPELLALLCQQVRSGALDSRWDETLQLILSNTIAKARIVRPDHLAAEQEPD